MHAQSSPALLDPMDCSPPDSPVLGISQARILEWVAVSFSSGSTHPGIKPTSYASAGRFFTCLAIREVFSSIHDFLNNFLIIHLINCLLFYCGIVVYYCATCQVMFCCVILSHLTVIQLTVYITEGCDLHLFSFFLHYRWMSVCVCVCFNVSTSPMWF